MQTSEPQNPGWWNKQHDSAWERVKEALRRDWEQTKADLTKGGTELNQDVGDTLGQAAGTKPLPPPNQPTPETDWNQAESAVRYGHGAREQYADENDWNDRLEGNLREEWNDLKTGRTWDEAKGHVKHGWRAGRATLS